MCVSETFGAPNKIQIGWKACSQKKTLLAQTKKYTTSDHEWNYKSRRNSYRALLCWSWGIRDCWGENRRSCAVRFDNAECELASRKGQQPLARSSWGGCSGKSKLGYRLISGVSGTHTHTVGTNSLRSGQKLALILRQVGPNVHWIVWLWLMWEHMREREREHIEGL